MKLFYIKIIIEFIILSKIILIKNLSDKTDLLILFNNNNIFSNIKLIIIILIIENVKINTLFLYINKKITLLILIIKQLNSFI